MGSRRGMPTMNDNEDPAFTERKKLSALGLLIVGLAGTGWIIKSHYPDIAATERKGFIEKYHREIESLKQDFPGQSGWLWLIINSLHHDLSGHPEYQVNDPVRSVVFGVLKNSSFSGSCLAGELTKLINRISSNVIHSAANFSFANIYCYNDCHRSKNPDKVTTNTSQEKKMGNAVNVLSGEDTVKKRLENLMVEVSQSGQRALFVDHFQAAPRSGLDLLLYPELYVSRPKPGSLGSLRLIFYMVYLDVTAKSPQWTVGKVRDYIVSLWPNLEPNVKLLLKTRLVGNVVLVRPSLR